MTLRSAVVAQFKQPRGLMGRAAGWIMANRPSNRARNRWTVDLLALKAPHRVIEIGCGPGLALGACLDRAREGLVVGIDHSAAMIAQATRRHEQAVAAGRLVLIQGVESALGLLDGGFDRAYAVNVVQFIADRPGLFRAIRDRLKPGGLVAMTYQPRYKAPTRADALQMAETLVAEMFAAGFANARVHELPLEPVPAVCVVAQRHAAY